MANYIMDLRKEVGHRPLLQCAASVILMNEKQEILLGKRTDNEHLRIRDLNRRNPSNLLLQ